MLVNHVNDAAKKPAHHEQAPFPFCLLLRQPGAYRVAHIGGAHHFNIRSPAVLFRVVLREYDRLIAEPHCLLDYPVGIRHRAEIAGKSNFPDGHGPSA